jgi:hypothetical protein
MEMGWADVGSVGYILVSCAHSITSFLLLYMYLLNYRLAQVDVKNKKGNSPLWLACNGKYF